MDKQKLQKIRQIQKKEIDKYKSKIALQTLFANTHMDDTHSSILDSSDKISHEMDLPYNIHEHLSPSHRHRAVQDIGETEDEISDYDSEISDSGSEISDSGDDISDSGDDISDSGGDVSGTGSYIQQQYSNKSFKKINGNVVQDISSDVSVSGNDDSSLTGRYSIRDKINDIDVQDRIYNSTQLRKLLSNPILLPEHTFNRAMFSLHNDSEYPNINKMIRDLLRERSRFYFGGGLRKKKSGDANRRKKGGMFHSLMMNEKIDIIIDPVKYSRKIVVEPKKIQISGSPLISSIDSIEHLNSNEKKKLLKFCKNISESQQKSIIHTVQNSKKSLDDILKDI